MKSELDQSLIKESEEAEENKQQNYLTAMPLYRCIYFDPTSSLVKVAQREEWSFQREFKLEGEHPWYVVNPIAEKKWKQYREEISEIEKHVKDGLQQLSEQIIKLNQENLNPDEKELLAEILLPLRYLMKHMAFKEEQECRVVYVTQWDDELVQYDEQSKRFYIDYGQDVATHLKKIYLGPHALHVKNIFE